jgi:hypothetical protein
VLAALRFAARGWEGCRERSELLCIDCGTQVKDRASPSRALRTMGIETSKLPSSSRLIWAHAVHGAASWLRSGWVATMGRPAPSSSAGLAECGARVAPDAVGGDGARARVRHASCAL